MNIECLHAECHYSECCFAEGRGAILRGPILAWNVRRTKDGEKILTLKGTRKSPILYFRRHDIQHDDTLPNDTQHNTKKLLNSA